MALDYKSSLARYRRYLQVAQARPLWRASLFIVLSLLLLIILLVAALRPTLVTIASLAGQIRQQGQIARQLDEKIATLAQAQQAYRQVQPRLVYLDEALPTNPRTGGWATSLESLATNNGLQVVSVSLSDISLAGQAPGEISFTLAAKGQYPQMRQVVEQLEKLRRIAILDSVQIGRSAQDELNLTVKGKVKFIYAQEESRP